MRCGRRSSSCRGNRGGPHPSTGRASSCRASFDRVRSRAMSAEPIAEAIPVPPGPAEHHLRTARRVFQGALLYNGGITLFWVVVMVLGPEGAPFFGQHRLANQAVVTVLCHFLF